MSANNMVAAQVNSVGSHSFMPPAQKTSLQLRLLTSPALQAQAYPTISTHLVLRCGHCSVMDGVHIRCLLCCTTGLLR